MDGGALETYWGFAGEQAAAQALLATSAIGIVLSGIGWIVTRRAVGQFWTPRGTLAGRAQLVAGGRPGGHALPDLGSRFGHRRRQSSLSLLRGLLLRVNERSDYDRCHRLVGHRSVAAWHSAVAGIDALGGGPWHRRALRGRTPFARCERQENVPGGSAPDRLQKASPLRYAIRLAACGTSIWPSPFCRHCY